MLGNRAVRRPGDLTRALATHRPGDEVTLQVRRRSERQPRPVSVRLEQERGVELVTVESAGGEPDGRQRAFRDEWLSTKFR